VAELILHHYDFSPFSEKVRLVFGLKRLAWRSVIIPAVMPKPDLLPLTGGYRHTPVLQIGADVFCDTRLIVEEIESRYPQSALWTAETEGFARAIEAWAERDLFWPIARYASGVNAEHLGPQFHADRAAMRGKAAPPTAALTTAARRALAALRVEVPRVESMLVDERPFLLGAAPGLADLAVYHGLWFLGALPIDCSSELAPYPHIKRWMARLAELGHGTRTELDAKAALRIAADAEPAPAEPSLRDDSSPAPGVRVSVRPEGYDATAVEGELVLVQRDRIALRRHDPALGLVHVHFPRLGYVLKELA
jgi:glutathione S-transferase